MKIFVTALSALVVAGCSTIEPSAYQSAAALPTPNSLTPNSRWAFLLLDANGKLTASLVVKLSDAPIETCDGGNYRLVEVVSDERVGGNLPIYDPAYEVVGAALRIQLSTRLCDNGYAIIGGVTRDSFEGMHMPEVLIAPKNERNLVLRAYGVRLPD